MKTAVKTAPAFIVKWLAQAAGCDFSDPPAVDKSTGR